MLWYSRLFCWSKAAYLVPSLSNALVLLLEILADCLCLALPALCLVLTRNHLLQLSVRQFILLPAHTQRAIDRSTLVKRRAIFSFR